MVTRALAKDSSYLKLLTELKSILIEGLSAIEEQRVKTYWQTGKLISKYLLANQERAGYGESLFERLSEDLEIERTILQRAAKFYRTFPICATWHKLSWSHYRELLAVENKQKRDYFQKQAINKRWNVGDLQKAIRIYKLKNKDLGEKNGATAPRLSLVRGRLYIYRLIKASKLNPTESNLLVDCGFNLWREVSLKGISSPREGEIVESIKEEDSYRLKASRESSNKLFTYKAFVERVVDADTIWVQIDLGFRSFSRQKVRFRGIDAPELSTKKGERAKEFVEAKLSSVSFVIIKTYSPDKYDRYLSDVFYLAGEEDPRKVATEGNFLNQELLDAGLARFA